jgi:hypothetical protein
MYMHNNEMYMYMYVCLLIWPTLYTVIKCTIQRYNAKILQQAQYKIARVTGLLHEDHTDLNHAILNDRHIYDVVV